mmetsp:Transcript_13304/g.28751  ORF Transcript_13304/g.28751 Transcript_13304/m.28751 type:complete len:89 (-) Transcript_13304:143-409(-)
MIDLTLGLAPYSKPTMMTIQSADYFESQQVLRTKDPSDSCLNQKCMKKMQLVQARVANRWRRPHGKNTSTKHHAAHVYALYSIVSSTR